MTEEQIVIIVAKTIERSMFAPHEFPLSTELHAKYLTTARDVIRELKFARPKLVAAADYYLARISRLECALRNLYDAAYPPEIQPALGKYHDACEEAMAAWLNAPLAASGDAR